MKLLGIIGLVALVGWSHTFIPLLGDGYVIAVVGSVLTVAFGRD